MSLMQNFINKVSSFKLVYLVIAGFAISIIIFGLLLLATNQKDESEVLYSDLSEEDKFSVKVKLNELGIQYKIDEEKKSIIVCKSDTLRTRAMLARHGLPSGCSIVGYEVYDKDEPLGTTSNIQHIKFVRALQGELTRTIKSFDHIFNARVHLSLPQKEIFSQERQKPTASVMLYTNNGDKLDKSTVNGICHLISCAVPGLSKKDITIVDSNGAPLHINGDNDNFLGNGVNKEIEHVLYYENHIKSNLETLIGRVVGFENVAVKVNLDMNFDSVTTSSEIYDPDTVAPKEEHLKDKKEISQKGEGANEVDTSVANNVPGAEDEQEISDGDFSQLSEVEKNLYYAVSKTVKNHIHQTGKINRISVAVLLNDISESLPQNDKEIREQKIAEIVKASVGYDENREDSVVVHTMHFFSKDELLCDNVNITEKSSWLNRHIYDLIKICIITFMLLISCMYLIRSVTKILMQKYKIADRDAHQYKYDSLNNKEFNINQPDSITNLIDQGKIQKQQGQFYQDDANEVETESDLKQSLNLNREKFIGGLRDMINSSR